MLNKCLQRCELKLKDKNKEETSFSTRIQNGSHQVLVGSHALVKRVVRLEHEGENKREGTYK